MKISNVNPNITPTRVSKNAVEPNPTPISLVKDSISLSGAAAVGASNVVPQSKLSHIGQAVSQTLSRPYLSGNSASVFIEGKEAFPQLFSTLSSAKEQINMEYFDLLNDGTGRQVADLLKGKAKDGVEVNLLLNYLTNHNNPLVDELKDSGVRVHFFSNGYKIPQLGIANSIDHRKLTMVDGKSVISGGMNIGDEYQNHWHDDMFKLEGPAISQYDEQFKKNWSLSSGEPLKNVPLDLTPKGNLAAQVAVTTNTEHEVHKSFLAAFGAAKDSILVNSPYFTNEEIIQSLIDASKRGVNVQVEIPTVGDNSAVNIVNDSVHQRLAEAGVTVHRFDTKNPAIKGYDSALDHFDHAKIATVDGAWSAIGTANMDDLSQFHIQEFNLQVDDKAFAKELEEKFFKKDFATLAKSTLAPEEKGWKAIAAPVLDALRGLF